MTATLTVGWLAVLALFMAAIWLPDHWQWALTAVVVAVPSGVLTVLQILKADERERFR